MLRFFPQKQNPDEPGAEDTASLAPNPSESAEATRQMVFLPSTKPTSSNPNPPLPAMADSLTKNILSKDVEIKGSNGCVLFVNGSMVIAKPIVASNGIIYVIDAVLIP